MSVNVRSTVICISFMLFITVFSLFRPASESPATIVNTTPVCPTCPAAKECPVCPSVAAVAVSSFKERYTEKEVFENMNATWPSPEVIRALSATRFYELVLRGEGFAPNKQTDILPHAQTLYHMTMFMPTMNPQPILMLHTQRNEGVLEYIANYAGEVGVTRTLRTMFEDAEIGCAATPEGGLFLDIGSNEGFYALLGAAYGCRTLTFEPQPECVGILSHSISVNTAFRYPPKLINKVVSPHPVLFEVPRRICNGGAQYVKDRHLTEQKITVGSVSIDDVITANGGVPAVVAHMDVEGAEIVVLRSGAESFKKGLIRNLVIEVRPERWSTYSISKDEGYAELIKLQDVHGFVCRIANNIGNNFPTKVATLDWKTFRINDGTEYDIWCTSEPRYKAVTQDSSRDFAYNNNLFKHPYVPGMFQNPRKDFY
jgi:FkbM family methyltransferase